MTDDRVVINKSSITNIANAIREKNGATTAYKPSEMAGAIAAIESGGAELPELTNEGTSADLLSGKQLIDGDGNVVNGAIETKTSSDLTASGAAVTVPAGYYASEVMKIVDIATQATPSISVDSSGLITASVTQAAGYVAAGIKSETKQLTTQAATIYTPTTSNQTIASGTYCSGAQIIEGDANLVAGNIKKGVSIFGVTGTHEGGEDLTAVINEQAALITELETALESAASGSGGASFETCTVTVSLDSSTMLGLTATTVDENGNLVVGYSGSLNSSDKRTSATLNNVLCGSMFDINVSMSVPLAITSGGVTAVTAANAYYASLSFIAPNESGAVGTVSISDDS